MALNMNTKDSSENNQIFTQSRFDVILIDAKDGAMLLILSETREMHSAIPVQNIALPLRSEGENPLSTNTYREINIFTTADIHCYVNNTFSNPD